MNTVVTDSSYVSIVIYASQWDVPCKDTEIYKMVILTHKTYQDKKNKIHKGGEGTTMTMDM
jgi:hypothetical protein